MNASGATGPASLWRHADFLKLWAAQSVSSLGARITREGLPFAAVMSLGATPAQVGILAALARGLGVPATRVAMAEEFTVALEGALAADGPVLIDAVLARG